MDSIKIKKELILWIIIKGVKNLNCKNKWQKIASIPGPAILNDSNLLCLVSSLT